MVHVRWKAWKQSTGFGRRNRRPHRKVVSVRLPRYNRWRDIWRRG